ncbi:MAG: phosphotransferase, partial [Bacteroidales bacterium]|nr:phosphotransferase [Bacteroidales bacterium]
VIAAYNERTEENDAFVSFSGHFRSKGLPVPEVFYYNRDEGIYFLEDLGSLSLFELIMAEPGAFEQGKAATDIYKQVLDTLLLFQTRGYEGLDLELCYPHRSFDSRSMMWDMNYFKYMFLNLMAVPYHERRLEHDFELLRDFLLSAPQDYFLYRDFQSANIMLRDHKPWFIDYQGGRKGAPQYDVASLLFDAKAHIPQHIREQLLNHYLRSLDREGSLTPDQFMVHYHGFALIRIMQALGAFGFRGLYENKPTFTESIVPAVQLMYEIIGKGIPGTELHELEKTIRNISSARKFRELEAKMADTGNIT